MKSLSIIFLIVAAILALTMGCNENSDVPLNALQTVTVVQSGSNCTDIMAGQNIDAGDICLTDDGTSLTIEYITDDPWELLEIHFWIGDNFMDIPSTKKGNPIPGQFPYIDDNLPQGTQSYTITKTFAELGFDCQDPHYLYIAAHCVVGIPDGNGGYTQTETGWGSGDDTPGKNWAEYFTIAIDCYNNGGGETGTCETAFAYGGSNATCFIDLGLGISRWGWTNGPLSEASYSFDIYEGAGQCDLSKGTLVGTLTVDYSSGTATVTYIMQPGYAMDETHLYVGNDILAMKDGEYTIAPGQYGNIHELDGATTDQFEITGLNGSIYVVAHAVVCEYSGPPCNEWIVYGNNLGTTSDPYGVGGDEDDIFAVDLHNQTISLLYNSSVVRADQNYPNGNAYDPINQWVYYATNDGYIIVYRMVENDRSNGLKDGSNPETRSIACGTWYDGSYYYIPQGTDDLIKADVTFDGTTWSLTRTDITSISGNTRAFSFGDLAFDINNPGLLLGSATSGGSAYFFKYDLPSLSGYTEYPMDAHLQLAYASNGILYGLDANTGDWYTVDPTNGNKTLFWENSGIHLTDLANGPQCQ